MLRPLQDNFLYFQVLKTGPWGEETCAQKGGCCSKWPIEYIFNLETAIGCEKICM